MQMTCRAWGAWQAVGIAYDGGRPLLERLEHQDAQAMPTRLPEVFCDKRWGALIGGYQKTKAARFTFDGRRLVCLPTWRVRLFYPIVASFILFGLGRMLYVIYRDGLSDGIQRGEGAALAAAAIFIPLLLLQFVWAFRYERSFTWDFVGETIVATRREFGRRLRFEMPAADVASVETTVIPRRRSRKSGSSTIDCHCLNLVLKDGQVLLLLETTDESVVSSVADVIRERAQLPMHA